jgi:abhydrolase domain-containing protein 13
VPNPYDEYGIDYEDLYLRTPDGEKLHAFLMLHKEPRGKKLVFMCHANAGNMGHRVPIAARFFKAFGYNVFIFSYRGYGPPPSLVACFYGSPTTLCCGVNCRYGKSTGSPSEKGLKIDAETCLQYIFGREELRTCPVFLYGQSLGGAVAIYLAEKHHNEVPLKSFP